MSKQAIVYYQQAAQLAVRIHALNAALSSLEKALALLKTLPDSKERAGQEIELQLGIGFAVTLTGAFASARAIAAFERSLELSQTLQKPTQTVLVLSGLWLNYLSRGEIPRAREIAQQLLSATQAQPEHPAFLMAHFALADILMFEGVFSASLELAMQAVAIYDPQRHPELILTYGYNPGLYAIAIAALVSWLLGHIERSLALMQRATALANDPSIFVFVHCMAAVLHFWRREVDEALEHSNAAIQVSEEREYYHWLFHARSLHGWAMVQQGQGAGIAQTQKAVLDWQAAGIKYGLSFHRVLLAEVYAQFGRIDEGLNVLSTAQAEATINGEHWMDVEILRLRGHLLERQQAPTDEVEACFRAAVEIAHRQDAKSLELRAATSLARLWQRQGKREEARQLLTEICNWFSEGFDTSDLQAAQALLQELASE